MKEQQLYYLSLAEASRLIASRRLSPVELLDAYLRRIDDYDDKLHSFLLVLRDAALGQARQMEAELMAGRLRGPLHGIPYGLKDVYSTAGIPTTGNSNAFKENIPKEDATVVRMLAAAGGVLVGKLATHELTYGGVSPDLPWPPTRNPWNLQYDSGGSSTGSGAAVAAGMCAMALGTDAGGSVRNPAGMCGIVGLRPTYGRVSRHGVMRNSHSLDACGPLARTVEDCALVLELIAGNDPQDYASAKQPVDRYAEILGNGIKGLRIGVVQHFYERDLPLDEEVSAAMDSALDIFKRLGAELKDVTLPVLKEYADCKVTIQIPEIYSVYRRDLEARPQDFGKKLRNRIMPGRTVSAVDYVEAQDQRRRLTAQTLSAMQDIDVLVTSGPGPAPRLTDVIAVSQLNFPEIAVPFSVTGMPAICLCNGFNKLDLPLSIQIVGRHFDEQTMLRAAHAYEQATPWHHRHPIA